MRKSALLVLLFCLFSLNGQAQIVKSGERFTDMTTFDGKIVFLKEFSVGENLVDSIFNRLKIWGKANFGTDKMNSTIIYNNKDKGLKIVSRIELILPEDSENVRKNIPLKYRADLFQLDDKYILEIKDITYFIPVDVKKSKPYNGEDVYFTENVSSIFSAEFKENLKKSTLFFFNELSDSLSNIIEKGVISPILTDDQIN